MLETTVRVCHATCVVLIAAGCAAAAAAVPGPRVEGTLSGLFMTPEGELVARSSGGRGRWRHRAVGLGLRPTLRPPPRSLATHLVRPAAKAALGTGQLLL